MMNRGLSVRDARATELMDDPHCDLQRLECTYAQFRWVNTLLGGRRGTHRREIRRRAGGGIVRVLDIGCGGADIVRGLARWAHSAGQDIDIVAIDPDARAIAWARRHEQVPGLTIHAATSADLVAAGEQFDVVISNHLLHHLGDIELLALLQDSEQLRRPGGVVAHRDIARSRWGFACFAAATAVLPQTHRRRSFLRNDGLTSIRRSYTPGELARTVPREWSIRRAWPGHLELRLMSP